MPPLSVYLQNSPLQGFTVLSKMAVSVGGVGGEWEGTRGVCHSKHGVPELPFRGAAFAGSDASHIFPLCFCRRNLWLLGQGGPVDIDLCPGFV